MKKLKLLKLKEEKQNKKLIREKVLQHRFFYKLGLLLSSFKEWFNNLNNTTLVLVVVIIVALINILINYAYPKFSIGIENFSEVKNKGFRLVNRHIYYALLFYIASLVIRIWAKYSKKPVGDIMK